MLIRRATRWGCWLGLVLACAVAAGCTLDMPGESYSGPLREAAPPLSVLAGELERDVRMLAGTIGERNMGVPDNLRDAEEFLSRSCIMRHFRRD